MEELNRKVEALEALLAQHNTGAVTVKLPPMRKLVKFSGKTELLKSWISDAKICVSSIPENSRADFIISHLDSVARDEIEFLQDNEKDTPDKIFAVLKEHFGEKRTNAQLKGALYSRRQNKGETYREFSRSLLELASKLDESADSKNKLLCEVLVENTSDRSVLYHTLAKLFKDDPNIRFSKLREEGIRLARDENVPTQSSSVQPKVREVTSADSVGPDSQSSEDGEVNGPSVSCLLQQVVKTQQDMLVQQNQMLNFFQQVAAQNVYNVDDPQVAAQMAYQSQPGYQGTSRAPRHGKNESNGKREFRGRCFYCNEFANHMQRNCPKKLADKQSGAIQKTPACAAPNFLNQQQGNYQVPQLGVGQLGQGYQHQQQKTHPAWLGNHQ